MCNDAVEFDSELLIEIWEGSYDFILQGLTKEIIKLLLVWQLV